MTWTSFAGCLYGAVKKAGLYEKDLVWMMGETGIAFHFIMEEKSCPSGPTVYNWQQEHFEMADRIGVASTVLVRHKDPKYHTFELSQDYAVDEVKRSLDRDVPVITWAPTPVLEFGLITGYDDAEGVFFVKDCASENPDPLLYKNIGISQVPILFVQSCYAKVPYDGETTLRNSLSYAQSHWNSSFHEAPSYAAGRKAWDNLLGTLERKDYDGFGLTYTMNLYADSKRKIQQFLSAAAGEYPAFRGLEAAEESAETTAAEMEKIASLLPFQGPGMSSVKDEDIPEILDCAQKALKAEEKTMGVIENLL